MKLLLENWREYVKQEVESFLPHGSVRDINMIGSSTLSPEEQDRQDMEKYGHIQAERDIDIEVKIADITREEAEEWAFSNEAEQLEIENNYDVQLTIVENWRRFLKEEEQEYEIYCDMDGVLVDFELGVVNYITARIQEGKLPELAEELGRDYITAEDIRSNKAVRNYMYKELENHAQFWEDLPWMPNGKELWARIWPYGPNILTTPMGYGSEIGKQSWIDKNLVEEMQMPPEKILMERDKYRWANKNSILIDDWTKNTVPWADKKIGNGIAILHKDEDIEKTLSTLQELGL